MTELQSRGGDRRGHTEMDQGTRVVLTIIQVLLGLFLVLAFSSAPLASLASWLIDDPAEPSAAETTVQATAAALFFLTIIFQFTQGSFPIISSLRRGSTIKGDWRFTASWPSDIGIGIGFAVLCLIGAKITTTVAAGLVGLDNADDATNTAILTDNEGSVWLYGIIVLVVIGAPLAEELLFRGYLLRTLQRFIGTPGAIVLSSVLFAIPHWLPDATWQETTVLLSALAVVGLVLAIAAVVTDRLAAAIIAHSLFNLTGTVFTLL